MPTKALLALLLATCAASLVWFFVWPDDDAGSGDLAPSTLDPGAPSMATDELVDADPTTDVGTDSSPETRTVAELDANAAPHPWTGLLAGITGRIVEVDGTPVAGIRVAFLEANAWALMAGDWERLGEHSPALRLDDTRTDADGRFVLTGGNLDGFHGLGIDLGGERATLRVLEHALVHGERTDLGDIVLSARGIVVGRVIDEQGAPVPGARVRMAPLPEDIHEVGLVDWRRDSVLAIEGMLVLELPTRLRAFADLMPIPTTFTRADGTFRLEGVSLGEVVGGVDLAGWLGLPIDEFEVTGDVHDLGSLVLTRGFPIRGIVVDQDDNPVAGVPVFAGAAREHVPACLLQPAGRTDAEGRFTVTGAHAAEGHVAAARRASHEGWVLSEEDPGPDGVRIVLPRAAALTVRVQDAAGEPLPDARLRVCSTMPGEDRAEGAELLALLADGTTPSPAFVEVETGVYRCDALTPGYYEVEARVEGYATAVEDVNHVPEGTRVTLTCDTGRTLQITVVDAATSQPVLGARASLSRMQFFMGEGLDVAWTDEEGRADLGPLADSIFELPDLDEGSFFGPPQTLIAVDHPGYARHVRALEPTDDTLTVELEQGAVIEGRIHWGGTTPTRPYMVGAMLEGNSTSFAMFVPRFALSGADGTFRFAQLVPGEYELEVWERFLDGNFLAAMRDEPSPLTVYRTEVDLVAGEVAHVEVDLSPSGIGPVGRITGRVHVHGHPLAGAEVSVQGNQDVEVETDARGTFDTGDVSVLRGVWLTIEGELELANGTSREHQIYADHIELEPDEVKHIELDLRPVELPVQVVELDTGNPIADAEVTIIPRRGRGYYRHAYTEARTDTTGRVMVLALDEGPHRLQIEHEDYTEASMNLDVTRDETYTTRRIELGRAVPCRGRIIADDHTPDEEWSWCYLSVQTATGNHVETTWFDREDLEFSIENLGPGSYVAEIHLDGQQSVPIPFDLGPNGDEHLEFVFVPAADD